MENPIILDSDKLKTLYLEFFKGKNHEVIPNAPLVPKNNQTVLFTTAGMHPLVPFLAGLAHPQGRRLVSVQRCLRTDDIFEIGDDSHLTFFEMLGNWSLGDYFKNDSIRWSFEFLTDKKWLGISKESLFVTVFSGDSDAPRDDESAQIWQSVGIPQDRIFYLPKKDNWWGPVGETGPCGPDTEIFYDTGKEPHASDCKPGCSCGKYFEIWNNVFTQYNKTVEGKYVLLAQKNVDTGMGVERTVACLNKMKSVYEIDTFIPIMAKIREVAKIEFTNMSRSQEKSTRIIADHVRASAFILSEGVPASNVERGYIVRRLLRRAMRHGKMLGIKGNFLGDLLNVIIEIHKKEYPELEGNREFILNEAAKEESRFKNTISRGLRKFDQLAKSSSLIDGQTAFLLYQSYGFPIELTIELARDIGVQVDQEEFEKEFTKHQQSSRKGSERKFRPMK